MEKLLLILITTLFAGALQGIMGFGSGLVAMAFLPGIQNSYPQGTALAGVGVIPGIIEAVLRQLRKIKWKVIIPICVLSSIVNPFCTVSIKVISADKLTVALGIVMIAISAFMLFGENRVRIKENWITLGVCGVLAGVIGGLFALDGMVVAIYLVNIIDDKDTYYATQTFFLLETCIYSAVVRVICGIITADLALPMLASCAGMYSGMKIGQQIRKKIDFSHLKRLIYAVVGICGVVKIAVTLL